MNDQQSSSPGTEHPISADQPAAGEPGAFSPAPETLREEPRHEERPSRRRRSERRDQGFGTRERSHRGRSRSKKRNAQLDDRVLERVMIAACGVLVLGGIFFIGFLFGQKAARSDDASRKHVLQEAEFASPDSEALLDKAFGELGLGDYRQAMENFQKVQDNQPALSGLDYLIAESAYKAGEEDIAQEKAASAISKNEAADDARVLVAMMNLNKTSKLQQEETQFADPKVTAETEIHHFAAAHPADARIYVLWGDLLRAEGSYRTAGDMFHKGLMRASPEEAREVLSAKEQLARLQNDPASTAPSLSGLTAMTAEQLLTAALTALQQHKSEDAAAFLERARDLYSPQVFRELMQDAAFTDYLADPELKQFFKPKNPATSS